MSMKQRILRRLISPTGLVPLAAAGFLLLGVLAESRAQPPSPSVATTARGKIDRFTTAPMGEVDGAVLDDGTWLHWPPHMQDRFANILKEGDRVRATGRTETGPAGDTHFEIQSVTNLRSNDTAENPEFANGPPPPPPGPRGRAVPPPPNADRPSPRADRDQRLRDLEDQVDQLRREIQRLRRER
jgi:hypothetical protein